MLMLILLPVYMENDETSKAEIMGIEAMDDMYEIQDIYFYRVDAIRPIDKNKCLIYSGGAEFMVALGSDDVRNIISQSIEINNSIPPRFEYHLN